MERKRERGGGKDRGRQTKEKRKEEEGRAETKIKPAEWLFLICSKYKELANSLDF